MSIDILKVVDEKVTYNYKTENVLHKHLQWELAIFEQGISKNIINDIEYKDCVIGDIFLLGPPHSHAIKFITTPHLHRDIYCSDSDIQKICAMFTNDLYSQACNPVPLHFKVTPAVLNSIIIELKKLEIYDSFENSRNEKAHLLKQSIANSVICFILGIFIREKYAQEDTIPKWFYEFMHKLQQPECLCNRITKITELSNYSHSQLAKYFKQYTGISLIDYVIQLRSDYASQLLRETTLTTIEIAQACGYESLSYFIKKFKEKFGTTPLKYRTQSKHNIK